MRDMHVTPAHSHREQRKDRSISSRSALCLWQTRLDMHIALNCWWWWMNNKMCLFWCMAAGCASWTIRGYRRFWGRQHKKALQRQSLWHYVVDVLIDDAVFVHEFRNKDNDQPTEDRPGKNEQALHALERWGRVYVCVSEYEYMMRVFMQHFIALPHKFIKFKTCKISSAITLRPHLTPLHTYTH